MVPDVKGNVKRVDQIVRVLAKYGLADWVGERTPGFVRRRFVTPDGVAVRDLPFEVRVRLALTELGTTFIKLGQMLSTRADMVGPSLAAELSSLQADTPADLPDAVRETLFAELGKQPEEVFAAFDYTALASASVGQVHLAELRDGSKVVVKVQHAGIEQKVRSDLSLLGYLAQIAETSKGELAYYRPSATVTQFSRSLLRELDFRVELNNLLQFERNFAEKPAVHIPCAFPAVSTRRVLVMERLEGYSIAKGDRMTGDGVDRPAFARLFAGTMLDMIFLDGFYHADPHPGNIFVLPDGRLGLLDCGKVGRVDERTRDAFITIVTTFVGRDVDGLTDELTQLCEVPPDLDRRSYHADVAEFVGEFADTPTGKLDMAAAFNAMFAIIRKYHLIVPSRVNMLLIVIAQTEGTARDLDADFSLTDTLQGYGAKLLKRRYSPARLQAELLSSARDWTRLLKAVPRETVALFDRTQRGELRIHIEHHGLQGSLNHLAYALVVAALLLSSSLLWAASAPPRIGGISVFGVLGTLLALILGLHLLYLLVRSSADR
jgi:ubiquinone biosynthesis protein